MLMTAQLGIQIVDKQTLYSTDPVSHAYLKYLKLSDGHFCNLGVEVCKENCAEKPLFSILLRLSSSLKKTHRVNKLSSWVRPQ